MSIQLPRTFKGKEYLLDDVNFIGTFNPFINNTYDVTIEDSVSNTPVDVYIFDTTNYPELTKEQFASVKTVSEIISSGTGTPSTYLTTNGLFNFNLDKSTKTKTINLNSTLSFISTGLYPTNQDQTIYDNIFIVLKVQETKTGKTYTDIPTREQLLLLPSSVLKEKNIILDFLIPGPNDTVWNETFATGLTNTILTNISLGGAIINTGKRIYYYGGMQGWNNITNNTVRDDAYYYSTVDIDGNISAPSAKVAAHPINKLMYMGTCVAGPNKEFIYTFGGYNTSNLNVSNIYRSTIDLNTGIPGAYTSIANLPVALRHTAPIVSDDGLTIYMVGGVDSSISSMDKIYVYSINPATGALTLTNTVTLVSAVVAISHCPIILNNAIYFFQGSNIYRINFVDGIPGSTVEKIGTLAPSVKGALAWFSLINDFENIYLIGGYASTSVKTSDEIHKISKSDLISASSTNLKSTTLMTTKVPLQIYNYNPYIPSTKKYYLIAGIIRKYTEQGTSDANVTSTAGNWLLPKAQVQSKIKMDSLQLVKSNDPLLEVPKEEFFRGKLYRRYRDEHTSTLIEKKSNPTNFKYNNITIKFKDPVTNTQLTLKTPTNWYFGISEDNKLFLDWLNTVCKATNFDSINSYQDYSETYGLIYIANIPRSSLKFNIPELFIFMLFDINFYNILNKTLNDYKIIYPTDLDISKQLLDFMKYKPLLNNLTVDYNNSGDNLLIDTNRVQTVTKSKEEIDYVFTPVIKNFFKEDEININSIKGPLWSHYLNNGQLCKYNLKDEVSLPLTQLTYLPTSGTYLNSGKMDRFEYSTDTGNPSIQGVHLYNANIYFNNNGVETNLGSYIAGLSFRYSGTTSVIITKNGEDILKISSKSAAMLALIYNTSTKTLSTHWNCGQFQLENLNNHFGAINKITYNYGSSTISNLGYSRAYANGVYVQINQDPRYTGYTDTYTGKTKTGSYYKNGLEDKVFEQVQAEIPYTLVPLSETDETNLQYDKLSRVTGINEINFEIE